MNDKSIARPRAQTIYRFVMLSSFFTLGITFTLILWLKPDLARSTVAHILGESSFLEFFALLFSFGTIAAGITTYLQHGSTERNRIAAEQLRELTQTPASTPTYTDSAKSGEVVEELSRRVDVLSAPFTDEQRVALAKAAMDAMATQAVSAKIEELAFRVGQDFQNGRILETLERNTIVTLARLNSAIPDLTKRANLNLAIGITTTLVGVAVLTFGVFVISEPATTSSATEYLAHLLPRVSLAVLVEVFAYFFLRLYKDNLAAITLLQNEMTNVEVARSALAVVILRGDTEATSRITTGMAAVDRNRTLSPPPTVPDVTAKSALELLNQAISLAKSAK
ncbi:MAG TPA: hypothetical protein VGQ21_05775 [Thermoanaerobaculia bacterium]|jgi:hypothetical protein|nr:hypothetical protein [Thermoanaerobaculia bacterium]